jgi:metallo-beta-lactamase family protein
VVPIFVDSPLAADMAEVYHRHRECLNIDYAGIDQSPADGDAEPRHAPIHYVRSADESKELSVRREPCVIIAPGGMCDGGRIVRHLKENVDDPRCSVVLVSYQAPGTLGRRLVQPGASVRIHGRKWNRWADIIELPGFSGHPDRNELLGFLTPLAGRVRKVRLVHGEWEQAEALAGALRQRGFADVAVPAVGEPVSL